MTQLIVALDLDSATEARGLANTLLREAGVEWFKVGPRTLLSSGASDLCERITDYANLFLDLKLYDTVDTVHATARRAFELGARFLTVHATPRMLAAAMRAKPDGGQKVLVINRLTDEDEQGPIPPIELADGVVCSVPTAHWFHHKYKTDKILVCPGIRAQVFSADGQVNRAPYLSFRNNHAQTATPVEAKAAGADYVVVGRPIINAADPVAAARAIMEELKS